MKNLVIPAFLALIASCATISAPVPVIELPAHVWVVSDTSAGSYGSCCPVGRMNGRTYFLTAKHCTEGVLEVSTELDSTGSPACLEWAHDEADIALISAQVDVPSLFEIRRTPVRRGERLYSAGRPHCRPLTIYEGLAMQPNRFSCLLGPGMSGGPVCDAQGRLVGVNSMMEVAGRFLRWGFAGYYVPAHHLPLF